ncbi:hypothetical protein [Campylobacter mucosalis]|uniref:hypothetical protein n=1 Tax=Campylobacter mucosalis TaxID=202 RepID=UPI00146FF2AA|nr:hypothetical protein [Campylobacter mucosalis]
MSRNEKLKIELDFLKTAFGTILLSFIGMVSYGFINYESLNSIKFYILIVAIFVIALLFIFVVKRVAKRLKELENLKDRK